MNAPQPLQANLSFQREQFYREVGARIRVIRESKHLTQEALASSIGLSRTSLTNIEKGRQKVLLHTLSEIAASLNVSADRLFPVLVGSIDVFQVKLPSSLPQTQKDFVQRALSPVLSNENSTSDSNSGAGRRTAQKVRDLNSSRKR